MHVCGGKSLKRSIVPVEHTTDSAETKNLIFTAPMKFLGCAGQDLYQKGVANPPKDWNRNIVWRAHFARDIFADILLWCWLQGKK